MEKDMRLFKEAGINYMRSLFYPFHEKALEICDRLGILTEQSASVYKVGKGSRASQISLTVVDCMENSFQNY